VDALLNAPAWLLAAGSVAAWCLVSLGMLALVRRFVAAKAGEGHNEVLGMLLGAAGIFCAIVVALAVFVVWDHLTTAHQAEADEGTALIVLYQDAEGLPPPARAQVEGAVRDYTTSAIHDQFPRLAAGQPSDATERQLARLNAVVRRYLASTSAPDQVANVAKAQDELDRAAGEGMAPLLWALLLGGCLLLLLMAALLSMEKASHHAIGAVLLGGALGASVFLILAADHPFAGPLQVTPGDLVQNLHAYAIMDGGTGTSP
jgi:Protein of unknown function (DUF4239)